ncbi:MAG UNVERIFIED_CONTAM: hypothetical protein LVQ98_06150 [Rickettsiaceae bacterium]|jgi:Rad3-related DNA helicase
MYFLKKAINNNKISFISDYNRIAIQARCCFYSSWYSFQTRRDADLSYVENATLMAAGQMLMIIQLL